MDDNNFQSSLCITSMKQKLSGPIEAHRPFIGLVVITPHPQIILRERDNLQNIEWIASIFCYVAR